MSRRQVLRTGFGILKNMEAGSKKLFLSVAFVLAALTAFYGPVTAALISAEHTHQHTAEETGHVDSVYVCCDRVPAGLPYAHFSWLVETELTDVVLPAVSLRGYVRAKRSVARAPPWHGRSV